MATLIIRSNLDTVASTLIPDLGILIGPAGGSETFTDPVNITDIQGSRDLRTLCTDGIWLGGAEVSDDTLILNDGTRDIPPDEVDDFLSPASSAETTTYVRDYAAGVAVRDVVYQRADGKVDQADASAVSTGIPVGFVQALDDPSVGKCVVRFAGDLDGFSGLTPGKIYILSTSPGQIVEETDTGNVNYPDTTANSGHTIAEVGIAGSATKLFVGTIRDFEEM